MCVCQYLCVKAWELLISLKIPSAFDCVCLIVTHSTALYLANHGWIKRDSSSLLLSLEQQMEVWQGKERQSARQAAAALRSQKNVILNPVWFGFQGFSTSMHSSIRMHGRSLQNQWWLPRPHTKPDKTFSSYLFFKVFYTYVYQHLLFIWIIIYSQKTVSRLPLNKTDLYSSQQLTASMQTCLCCVPNI